MNSNTEIIIVAVLVSLLVISLTYLTYLVVILRRKNKNKEKNEDLALENGKLEVDISSDDQLPTKSKDVFDASDISRDEMKLEANAAHHLDDNKTEVLAKILEQRQKEPPNLSVLTDGSQASTRSQISEPGSKQSSEKGSTKFNTTGEVIEGRNVDGLLPVIASGKRPPECPYKGKLQCSCQQSKRPADGQRQIHYPTYTSKPTKSQASMVSGNRHSMSRLEATISKDVDDVKEWISSTKSKQHEQNGVSSKENLGDANEDEDDITPIMTRMQALGKEVIPPVASDVRHHRTLTDVPGSPHASFHTRTRPTSPLSSISSARARNRPVSPLSPVYRVPPGYIYPNGTWNNVQGWQNSPNHSVPSTSPTSLNLMPSYQMWTQSPPRHQGSPFATSYKSLPIPPVRRSEDYYQQRR
ncbi:hypothetical protein K450DRAFT_269758 [Umbelopsis ramanniana AG]|uniref:Uncharacterized protein n=1 Tax=Umbelopsis ramanniana AG TaxID=1314678 RepID=A0AAD5HF26_UMBRA|nr:uncharacterized protein K450DRAFT_269758 [Umbelopsis ramanniana AG]KAI8581972.1 hypothetical protein K450DRAFT_269758 [Umbelopsis ramanniana AG]